MSSNTAAALKHAESWRVGATNALSNPNAAPETVHVTIRADQLLQVLDALDEARASKPTD